jgi:site-specific DNA-cytosine methylase
MVKWARCSYADDFSGAGTLGLGLKRCAAALPCIARPVLDHVFSCDKLRASKKMIMHVDPPRLWLENVQGPVRNQVAQLRQAKTLNVYQFTAPCQGWSAAGNQEGADDPRSLLALAGVATIQVLLPGAFISENVTQLLTNANFKRFFDMMINKLKNAGPGYKVCFKVMSSKPYVPQARNRLYIIGIKNTKLRQRNHGVPFFPNPPVNICPSIISLLTPLRAGWKAHPDKADGGKYANVIQAYREVKDTVNPFKVPVIIDCGSSPRYSSFRISEAPTLTRTRSSQKDGYWCSTKGGGLDATELAKLQGFEPDEFPWKEVGLSHSAAGGLMGNAQTLPLVADILCHVLFHSSQIDFETFQTMKKQFQHRE